MEYQKNSTETQQYYLSGKDHECAFKGFGTNRKEAIRKIKEHVLKSKTLQKILQDSIKNESTNNQMKIWGSRPETISDKEIASYLSFYQNNKEMIEVPLNIIEGSQIQEHHTLLTALAYTFKLSLEVYTKSDSLSSSLSLCASYPLFLGKQQKQPTLRLLHHKGHFNLLLSKNNDKTALERENNRSHPKKTTTKRANDFEIQNSRRDSLENTSTDMDLDEIAPENIDLYNSSSDSDDTIPEESLPDVQLFLVDKTYNDINRILVQAYSDSYQNKDKEGVYALFQKGYQLAKKTTFWI